MNKPVPAKVQPEGLIIRVRGQAAILDSDLAALYEVSTKRLNEQVKRNKSRFPEDFMFRLPRLEFSRIRSQNATASRRNTRYLPCAFTEHGAVMAANVLRSDQAIHMSVAIVRAFVRLRRMALSVESLARKVDMLEKKYDKNFQAVFQAVRLLMTAPRNKRVSGFSNAEE